VVSRYQKGKTSLDFTEARDSEWQWHQLGCMQVCTSLLTDNHASVPPLSFLRAGCPFLLPNQQHQSTEYLMKLFLLVSFVITRSYWHQTTSVKEATFLPSGVRWWMAEES